MPAGTPVKAKKRKPSVLKRVRQTERRTAVNRANKARVRRALKQFRAALAARDAARAEQLYRPTISALDRAIQKGVLHENTASRMKSRLTVAYNELRGGA